LVELEKRSQLPITGNRLIRSSRELNALTGSGKMTIWQSSHRFFDNRNAL